MRVAFAKEALQRVPLAEAVLLLWEWICQADALTDLFGRHRGACRDETLKFSTLVALIFNALVQHRGSGRQAFLRAQEDGELPVSIEATYAKLRRLPFPLSQALLAEATDQLREIFPKETSHETIPSSLKSFTVIAFDGKTIKRLPKRLKPLRKSRGGILGGKALVALELESGLACALATDPDGETNDSKLVPGLLPQVRDRHASVLWVGDRQFCDPKQAQLLLEREGDHLLVRWSKKNTFVRDESRPLSQGIDKQGRRWTEEWGWMGGPRNKHRMVVRRIRLSRPGEEEIVLITDLIDEGSYPAEELLELYLARWGIERVFQTITEVFELSHLIGTTPKATLFQLSFCLLLYNSIQLVKGYVAEGGEKELGEVSTELLFEDVRRDLVALAEMVSVEELVEVFEPAVSREELCQRLRALLGGSWTERWRKAPPKKIQSPHAKETKQTHTSAYRLIEDYQSKRKKIPIGAF